MDGDEKTLVMNLAAGLLGLEHLGVQDLVQLEVLGVADPAGVRQLVGAALDVGQDGGGGVFVFGGGRHGFLLIRLAAEKQIKWL